MQNHNSGNIVTFEISKTSVAWVPAGGRGARVGDRPPPWKKSPPCRGPLSPYGDIFTLLGVFWAAPLQKFLRASLNSGGVKIIHLHIICLSRRLWRSAKNRKR